MNQPIYLFISDFLEADLPLLSATDDALDIFLPNGLTIELFRDS